MIKANDLRIGNLVNYDNTDTPFCVTEISQTGIGVKNDEEETWIEIDQFSPIPLTPEILEKVGFENKNGDNRWYYLKIGISDNEIMIAFLKNGIDIYLVQFGSAGIKPNCQSLHQLQNVYYWNSGEELQIDLKEFVTIK